MLKIFPRVLSVNLWADSEDTDQISPGEFAVYRFHPGEAKAFNKVEYWGQTYFDLL